MSKLEETRTRLGVKQEDMAEIVSVYVAASLITGEAGADKIPALLNKYETEILRQQEVIARLQQKNRNYRSGVKQLQRAHEASLHREKALQETVSRRLDKLEQEDSQYSRVNFRLNDLYQSTEFAYSSQG